MKEKVKDWVVTKTSFVLRTPRLYHVGSGLIYTAYLHFVKVTRQPRAFSLENDFVVQQKVSTDVTLNKMNRGMYQKLFHKAGQQYRAKLECSIAMMSEADPQSGNLYDQFVIWSTTSKVASRILQYREKKLKEDSIWIRGALT